VYAKRPGAKERASVWVPCEFAGVSPSQSNEKERAVCVSTLFLGTVAWIGTERVVRGLGAVAFGVLGGFLYFVGTIVYSSTSIPSKGLVEGGGRGGVG